jgi:hypothetical protein
MHVQIVEFDVQGVGRAEFEARCERLAPAFAEIPGLMAKLWIVDPESNRAGGIYTWADRAACDGYVAGDLFAAVRADPALGNLRSRRFDVLEAASAITLRGGGMSAVAGVEAHLPVDNLWNRGFAAIYRPTIKLVEVAGVGRRGMTSSAERRGARWRSAPGWGTRCPTTPTP